MVGVMILTMTMILMNHDDIDDGGLQGSKQVRIVIILMMVMTIMITLTAGADSWRDQSSARSSGKSCHCLWIHPS